MQATPGIVDRRPSLVIYEVQTYGQKAYIAELVFTGRGFSAADKQAIAEKMLEYEIIWVQKWIEALIAHFYRTLKISNYYLVANIGARWPDIPKTARRTNYEIPFTNWGQSHEHTLSSFVFCKNTLTSEYRDILRECPADLVEQAIGKCRPAISGAVLPTRGACPQGLVNFVREEEEKD